MAYTIYYTVVSFGITYFWEIENNGVLVLPSEWLNTCRPNVHRNATMVTSLFAWGLYIFLYTSVNHTKSFDLVSTTGNNPTKM